MASVETVLIVGGGIAGLTVCFTSVIPTFEMRVGTSRSAE
jgi:hypothetical protein